VKSELQKLYDHIDEIEIAMMTTKREDGHLVSRAMATQKRADGADLWFVTRTGMPKLDEIEQDPHVNLTYYKDRTREWVSVSGLAFVTQDRAKIRELYAADWKAWFPDEGDPRHGTPDDPRMVLIGIDVHAATFLEVDKPQPVVLFEVVKGWLTGTMPDIGEMHHVGGRETKSSSR
jgi:general stress protein 26